MVSPILMYNLFTNLPKLGLKFNFYNILKKRSILNFKNIRGRVIYYIYTIILILYIILPKNGDMLYYTLYCSFSTVRKILKKENSQQHARVKNCMFIIFSI